jgi:hypothetical protein
MILVCCSCGERGKARREIGPVKIFFFTGREGEAGRCAWCEYRCGTRRRTGP